MELRKEDLPATIQAFDLDDNQEVFIAEQVVNSQAEIDSFTNRYAGKLIKAKTVVTENSGNGYDSRNRQNYNREVPKRNNNAIIVIIILIIIAALIAYGFYTGWIPQKIDANT